MLAGNSIFATGTWLALLAVVGALLIGFSAVPDRAMAIRYDQSCGRYPPTSPFSFVRAKGTNCGVARKATRKAWRKFCSSRNGCKIDRPDLSYVFRGKVKRNGWRCRVFAGWETRRVQCRKGQRVVLWISGL